MERRKGLDTKLYRGSPVEHRDMEKNGEDRKRVLEVEGALRVHRQEPGNISLNSFPVFIPNTPIHILYFSQLDNPLGNLKDQVFPSTLGMSPLWRVSHITPIYHPSLKTLLILQDWSSSGYCIWVLNSHLGAHLPLEISSLSTLVIRAQIEFLLKTKFFVYLSYS